MKSMDKVKNNTQGVLGIDGFNKVVRTPKGKWDGIRGTNNLQRMGIKHSNLLGDHVKKDCEKKIKDLKWL